MTSVRPVLQMQREVYPTTSDSREDTMASCGPLLAQARANALSQGTVTGVSSKPPWGLRERSSFLKEIQRCCDKRKNGRCAEQMILQRTHYHLFSL